MKQLLSLALTGCLALPLWAETTPNPTETEGSGFVTSALNGAIERAWAEAPQAGATSVSAPAMQYGRKVTGFASAPKFGGYYIGKYDYSDRDLGHGGTGFSQRLIRAYVDGTILRDFKYRIQVQMNNGSFHMKDVFIEWQRYDFARIKVGQFKRAFGFENPMNPWDILTGDYSYFTKRLTNDYRGEAWSGGGRDQGIQVQGDLLPVGKDSHKLIHYQIGLWNGPGINKGDNDGKKDVIGTLQVQPIKDLWIAFFGWHGNADNATLGSDETRNKYAFGAKYDYKGWTLRGEWGHAQYSYASGATVKDDVWYVVCGMPVNDWFKVNAQYQTLRLGKSWAGALCTYSLIPEFQLHKNLKLQIQYNWNDNRGTYDQHYNELWAEFYFRF